MGKLKAVIGALLFVACSSDGESAMDAEAMDTGSAKDAGHDAGVAGDAARPMAEARAGLSGVWGSDVDDVWAVGEAGTILHYDGVQWTAVESPATKWLTAVSGSASDDVWAVGESIVLHWDGTVWSDVLMDPHLEEQLLSVWSGGRDSVFMVGFTTDTNRGLLRRWNGTAWSWAEVGPGAMWEIWGSSSSDVWFGGTGDMAQGFIARGDGMNFEPVEYSGGSLRGIWGTSSEDVWAVPYDGDFQHWDGSSWTEFPLPRGVTATAAIAGIGPSDAWAVGLDGLILHWDGESWTRRASNTDAHLLSVWPANENDAWAVGQDGILLHWNGTDWRETEPAEAE